MINWYRVHRTLKEYVPADQQGTLEKTLRYLYINEDWSLTDILNASNREIHHPATISIKLSSLGIPVKKRGGHNKATLPLTLQDFIEYSAIELARKYNVHITTIYKKKKEITNG